VEFDEETLCQAQQIPAEKRPTESSETARRLDRVEESMAEPIDQEDLMSMARRALEMIGPDAVPSSEPVATAVVHRQSKGKKKKQTVWPAIYKEAEKSPL
jgi:hypothetical protein